MTGKVLAPRQAGSLAPELPGRTVDLTVAFVFDGREIQRQSARLDTTGVASQGTVIQARDPSAEFDFEFNDQEFAAMFDGGRAPVLRLILDVR